MLHTTSNISQIKINSNPCCYPCSQELCIPQPRNMTISSQNLSKNGQLKLISHSWSLNAITKAEVAKVLKYEGSGEETTLSEEKRQVQKLKRTKRRRKNGRKYNEPIPKENKKKMLSLITRFKKVKSKLPKKTFSVSKKIKKLEEDNLSINRRIDRLFSSLKTHLGLIQGKVRSSSDC